MGRWLRVAMVVCAMSMAACADDAADDTAIAKVKSPLLRTGALFPQGRVRVCWQLAGNNNPTKTSNHPQFAALSQQIRDHLENTISRVSAVKFTDWTDCTSTNPAALGGWMAIRFLSGSNNNPPGWADLGYNPNRWTELVISDYSPFYSPDSIRMLTQHETMHALGFDHEYIRKDNPNGSGSVSYEYLTPYDSSSITNIRPSLSPWDVVGLQQAYGFKRDGALVGSWGRCLSIPNSTNTAAQLTAEDCDSATSAQIWSRRSTGQLFSYAWSGSWNGSWIERSATAYTGGPSTPVPIPLTSEATNGGNTQQFDFTDVEIRAMGDWCVAAGEMEVGSQLRIVECGLHATARWDYEKVQPLSSDPNARHRFRLHGTNLCLTVPWDFALPNEPLVLQTCGGSARPGDNPYWPMLRELFSAERGYGRLKAHAWAGTRCIGVKDSNPVQGQRVVTMDCDPQYLPAVHLYVRGQIRSRAYPSKCINNVGGFGAHGSLVEAAECALVDGTWWTPVRGQSWDYHPVFNSAATD